MLGVCERLLFLYLAHKEIQTWKNKQEAVGKLTVEQVMSISCMVTLAKKGIRARMRLCIHLFHLPFPSPYPLTKSRRCKLPSTGKSAAPKPQDNSHCYLMTWRLSFNGMSMLVILWKQSPKTSIKISDICKWSKKTRIIFRSVKFPIREGKKAEIRSRHMFLHA